MKKRTQSGSFGKIALAHWHLKGAGKRLEEIEWNLQALQQLSKPSYLRQAIPDLPEYIWRDPQSLQDSDLTPKMQHPGSSAKHLDRRE